MDSSLITEQEKEIAKQTSQFLSQYHMNALSLSILAHVIKKGIPLTIFDIKRAFSNIDEALVEKELEFLYKGHYLRLKMDQTYYADLDEVRKEHNENQEKILQAIKKLSNESPIIKANKIIIQYFSLLFEIMMKDIIQYDKMKLRKIRQQIKEIMIQTFQKVSDDPLNRNILMQLSSMLQKTEDQLNVNQFHELLRNSVVDQMNGIQNGPHLNQIEKPLEQEKIEENLEKPKKKTSKSKKKSEQPKESNKLLEKVQNSENIVEERPANELEKPTKKKISRKKSSKNAEK